MNCPDPDCDGNFKCYSSPSEESEDGKVVTQYRKCDKCGETGKTTYQKWACYHSVNETIAAS